MAAHIFGPINVGNRWRTVVLVNEHWSIWSNTQWAKDGQPLASIQVWPIVGSVLDNSNRWPVCIKLTLRQSFTI